MFPTNWDNAPIELLEQIFSYLSSQDLAMVGRICKEWNIAASSSRLWKRLSQQEFYLSISAGKKDDHQSQRSKKLGYYSVYIEEDRRLLKSKGIKESEAISLLDTSNSHSLNIKGTNINYKNEYRWVRSNMNITSNPLFYQNGYKEVNEIEDLQYLEERELVLVINSDSRLRILSAKGQTFELKETLDLVKQGSTKYSNLHSTSLGKLKLVTNNRLMISKGNTVIDMDLIKLTQTIIANTEREEICCFQPLPRIHEKLIGIGTQNSIKLFDLRCKSSVMAFDSYGSTLALLEGPINSNYLYSGGRHPTFNQLDLRTVKLQQSFYMKGCITSIAELEGNNVLIAGHRKGLGMMIKFCLNQPTHYQEIRGAHKSSILNISTYQVSFSHGLSPNAKPTRLLTCSTDGLVNLWHTKVTASPMTVLKKFQLAPTQAEIKMAIGQNTVILGASGHLIRITLEDRIDFEKDMLLPTTSRVINVHDPPQPKDEMTLASKSMLRAELAHSSFFTRQAF